MPVASLLRVAVRTAATAVRTGARAAVSGTPVVRCRVARAPVAVAALPGAAGFSTTPARCSAHQEETFEEFTARFEKEFDTVQDVFELQRNLNNCFAYDLVPSPTVITAALRAARRVNDFPTAVRVFEAIKNKVENRGQYDQYLQELKALREEFGVPLKEDMYPDDPKNWKTMS